MSLATKESLWSSSDSISCNLFLNSIIAGYTKQAGDLSPSRNVIKSRIGVQSGMAIGMYLENIIGKFGSFLRYEWMWGGGFINTFSISSECFNKYRIHSSIVSRKMMHIQYQELKREVLIIKLLLSSLLSFLIHLKNQYYQKHHLA